MNVHKKIGPFPVWAWGVAIAGGLVLGIYLRRRAAASSGTNPNQAIGDYLAAAGGGGIADPNAGLDSSGALAGILDQNQQVLDYLLSLTGGGSVPAIADPATYEPQTPTPTNVASSGGSGASPNPNPAAPAPTEPTFTPATTGPNLYETATSPIPGVAAQTLDPGIGAFLVNDSPFTTTTATSSGPSAQLYGSLDPGIASQFVNQQVAIPDAYNAPPPPMPIRGKAIAL